VPSPLVDYEIRPPQPNEFATAGDVVSAAFGEHGPTVAALVRELRKIWDRGRGFELVAVHDCVVIGHVGFTQGYLDSPDRLRNVLVLSPLGVRPEMQGGGVGAALVKAGLQLASGHGFDLVFLEGAPRLYPKLGFVEAGPEDFGKPSVRIPDRAFQVYYLTDEGRALSGALVYPDVFWELDCVGLREPDPRLHRNE
jgi:putative acetyltransferase